MSQKDKRITEIASAIKHEIRRVILKMLVERTSIRYSDLMVGLGLEPKDNSGSFGYHIKILTDAGLIVAAEKGYTLTELGKRVLGFLNALDHEDRDKYRIISALQSLTTRDEVHLFLAQSSWMFIAQLVLVSLFGITVSDKPSSWRVLGALLSFAGAGLILIASIKTLYSLRSKLPKGLSKLFFLNTNWIYASPNRNKFALCFVILIGAFMTSFIATLEMIELLPQESSSSVLELLSSLVMLIICGGILRSILKSINSS